MCFFATVLIMVIIINSKALGERIKMQDTRFKIQDVGTKSKLQGINDLRFGDCYFLFVITD